MPERASFSRVKDNRPEEDFSDDEEAAAFERKPIAFGKLIDDGKWEKYKRHLERQQLMVELNQ